MKIVTFKDKYGCTRKEYKVIPENLVVVGYALRKGIFDELVDVCTEKELDCMPWNIKFDGLDELHRPTFATAKAKCDPRDAWDEKTGIDITSAKLDLKEHERKARKLEKTLVVMNSAMRKMEDLCQKHKQKAKAIKNDLENYYGGTYK